jgi:hypothetical protein
MKSGSGDGRKRRHGCVLHVIQWNLYNVMASPADIDCQSYTSLKTKPQLLRDLFFLSTPSSHAELPRSVVVCPNDD